MKRLLPCVLLSLLWVAFAPLLAQVREDMPPKPTDETYEYVPFPTDNAVWTNRSFHNLYGGNADPALNFFSSVFMKGDTIWEGHTYSKLYVCKGQIPDYSPEAFWGGLREENKRIYIRQSKTFQGDPYAVPLLYPTGNNSAAFLTPDYKEHLYYDFNISADPQEIIAQFGMSYFIRYDRSDYEWIGGRWRRVSYFKSLLSDELTDAILSFRWIDGIGNDRGLGYNGCAITTSNVNFRESNLLCFFQDGEQLYHADNIIFPFEGSDDCFRIDDLLMGVTAIEPDTGTPIRYEDGHLVWNLPVFSRVLLYDMQGCCVFRAETVGMNAVDLKSSMPAGIYLYCADDVSGNRYSGKVNISQ